MKKFQYGGQAVLEGVMMRGKDSITISVRQPDGNVAVNETLTRKTSTKPAFFKWPLVRGVVNFVDSLVVGMNSLMYSASKATDEEETKLSPLEMTFTIVSAIALFIGLFIILPNVLVAFLTKRVESAIVINLVEGVLRLVIFVIYLFLVSRLKDIQRVFQYHGAEHKTISTWEAGEELTVANARKYTTLHPRCGTNFLLIVMVVSIILFSFLGRQTILLRILSRILLLPLVAGVSYEFLKFAGTHCNNPIVALMIKPGLMLQKLTTVEPDDSQLEVAIISLKSVMANDIAVENGLTASIGEKLVRYVDDKIVSTEELYRAAQENAESNSETVSKTPSDDNLEENPVESVLDEAVNS